MPQDVITYYEKVFPKLKKFLKKREIATKTYFKEISIIKRGSKDQPLFIDDLTKNINKKFLKLRQGKTHLNDVKSNLNKKQINIWKYFVPRKLVELYYATNHEHPNKPLDRIYFDIDRKNIPAEKAQLVALKLIETIKKDKSFKLKYKIFPMWTGNSFHIYLLLKKKVPHSYYEKNIRVELKNQDSTFTGRWAQKINKELKNIKVIAGHEKKDDYINIDPSQSPSGKLARSPFSLYIKKYTSIRGIALPLSIKDLENKNLIKELRSYNQEKVLKDLDNLAKKLP